MLERQRLFVYGTLLQGESNHYYLRHALLLGSDFVSGRFYRSEEGYPILKLERNATVWGEIYGIREIDLEQLDRLEGIPDLFQRVQVSIGGRPTWIYVAGKRLQHQCHYSVDSRSWLLTCYRDDPLSALGAGMALAKEQLSRVGLPPPQSTDNFIWMPGDSPVMLIVFPSKNPCSLVLAIGVAVHCAYGAHLCYVPWEEAADRNSFFSRLAEVLRKSGAMTAVELEGDWRETNHRLDAGAQSRLPWLCGSMKVVDRFQSAFALFGLPGPRIEHSARSALAEKVALQLKTPAARLVLGTMASQTSNPPSDFLPLVQSLGAFTAFTRRM
ncbi:MAG TPA: gamma-glutamylcyclotransferase family protein [Acidobacteriota bacterium]